MKTSKINKMILVIGIIITLLAPNMCMAVEEITNGADKDTPLEEEKIEPSVEPSSENDADTEKDIVKDEEKTTTEDIEDTGDKDLPKEETEESSENTNKPEPATIEATQSPTKIAQPRGSVITVVPGEGTLQDALSTAQDTDVIQLQRGRYTGEKIIINKSVTIRGVGASSGSGTSILPKIEIEVPTAETKVVLENFFIGSQQPPVEANYKFINIKTPVNIEMNNLGTSFIGRGSDVDTNAVTINMESGSSGSTVNINNSTLYSAVNGIKVSSSNNNITLDKTFLYGKYALTFDKGGDSNTLTVKNGSTISGRSAGFYADEAIQIIKQNKLTINVVDSTIQGNDARGDGSTHIFSIDGSEPSTNVKIDIEEDGRVSIYSENIENAKSAFKTIEELTREIEVGNIYNGVVSRIASFGAFIDLGGGKEGLLHISKISNKRVDKVEDVLSVGDEVTVKVSEIDNQGRINLNMKDLESRE